MTDCEKLKLFHNGLDISAYDFFGCHNLGEGKYVFRVWAPHAVKVSVVGDFNMWDGRRHQMRRLGDHGVFELFIPGLDAGCVYKYEVKAKNGDAMLKADPYGS